MQSFPVNTDRSVVCREMRSEFPAKLRLSLGNADACESPIATRPKECRFYRASSRWMGLHDLIPPPPPPPPPLTPAVYIIFDLLIALLKSSLCLVYFVFPRDVRLFLVFSISRLAHETWSPSRTARYPLLLFPHQHPFPCPNDIEGFGALQTLFDLALNAIFRFLFSVL